MSDDSGELLRRSRSGDRLALDELLRRHLPAVRAFARVRMGALLRAHDSSSDLVQSACIELLQQEQAFEFRGEGPLRAWLCTTVLNKIRQHERHLMAQKRDVRRHAPREGSSEHDADDLAQCYSAVLSPSQELIATEDLRRMEAAMDTLPESYREVIALSRIAGMTRGQVAEEMQRTEASIRNLLPRALVALAEAMEAGRSETQG